MELLSVNTNARPYAQWGRTSIKGLWSGERFTAGPRKETGGPRLEGPRLSEGFSEARLKARGGGRVAGSVTVSYTSLWSADDGRGSRWGHRVNCISPYVLKVK